MIDAAASASRIIKVKKGAIASEDDFLAAEEPLEVGLIFGDKHKREKRSISVTMRTPGNDKDLALGFLFTEGILTSIKDLKGTSSFLPNTIDVELCESIQPEIKKLDRNFYTTSSCGVCGKSSIDAIRTVAPFSAVTDTIQIDPGILYRLPAILRKAQQVFEKTGGLHAAAIFDLSGKLQFFMEDVGRHNALDKVVGFAFKNEALPLNRHILLLSGRTSFELVQKAAMAGIKVVASVGAPSNLALNLAIVFDITLVGFLQDARFNVYCNGKRIALSLPHNDL